VLKEAEDNEVDVERIEDIALPLRQPDDTDTTSGEDDDASSDESTAVFGATMPGVFDDPDFRRGVKHLADVILEHFDDPESFDYWQEQKPWELVEQVMGQFTQFMRLPSSRRSEPEV
jgi:hypothetical protein